MKEEIMEETAKILLLGTYHLGKSGNHLIDLDTGDVTTDKKQHEINEVVQKLIKFKLSKIAVEANREKAIELNKIYSEFCTDNSIKSNDIIDHRNEIVQIAFRLAKN